MDPLITVSQAHSRIYEMLNVHQKLLQEVKFLNASEYVKTLNKVFTDAVVPHFEFEESEIFPVVFARKDLGLDKIISEFLEEHKQIIRHLAGLSERNAGIMNTLGPSKEENDNLLASCNMLTREVIAHAQKEDSDFYPLVKDIMFKMR